MAANFNDLLREAGFDPREVRLLRHQTSPGRDWRSLHELWLKDREGFERYQSIQRPEKQLFRNGPVWAAFVSPSLDRTLFVGLYDARYLETRPADWTCPYKGDAPYYGRPVDHFETRLRPELAEQIGRLEIAWDPASVRNWDRYAAEASFPLVVPTVVAEPVLLALLAAGFQVGHATNKVLLLRRGRISLYLKRETGRNPLVLHPLCLDFADELAAIPGVILDRPVRPYIHSNLRAFPVYEASDRQTPSRFGLALTVRPEAVPQLVARLDAGTVVQPQEGPPVRLAGEEGDPLTERERLAAARVGQGDFRTALIGIWAGACPVAGVDELRILRASHIKPWRASTNLERLDPYNGLLLCANIDALFDRGLISFTDEGVLLISPDVSAENRERLGLGGEVRIAGLKPAHAPYLQHHREQVFQR